jgi:hypothetical protein
MQERATEPADLTASLAAFGARPRPAVVTVTRPFTLDTGTTPPA